MNASPPPVRALIARTEERNGLKTRVVLFEEVPFWAGLGWQFVCMDPEDEFQLIYWLETEGRRR